MATDVCTFWLTDDGNSLILVQIGQFRLCLFLHNTSQVGKTVARRFFHFYSFFSRLRFSRLMLTNPINLDRFDSLLPGFCHRKIVNPE